MAWAAFAVTVPSAVWRVLMIVGAMPGTGELRNFELGDDHVLAYVYVFGLSVVQLAAAFATVGLVRPWGTTIFGRVVPRWPVIAVATMGGLAVTWLFTISMSTQIATGHRPDAGHVSGIPLVVMVICYAPIVLWGPLELWATYGYWRYTSGRTSQAPATVSVDR
ncbi:hypothetical protein QMK17_03640 [Rhodococcus sp. G-MC3]|uniref:hypothetical protein n=1 Tax=Rhodococcus sp. G-MC3 TaxID=3046209 RepID=UPI0024BB7286|nr:hypothetical protein [Rhodococcus sp. G-MC3]MDJ0392425.1 hypothetical protein [Rhodococcus sp. G-MC3]